MSAQVDHLGHRVDQGWLFRHVAFDLNFGDRLLIQGRNGSGKSTLLKCLVGLMIPREGTFTAPETIGYAALDQSLGTERALRDGEKRSSQVPSDRPPKWRVGFSPS